MQEKLSFLLPLQTAHVRLQTEEMYTAVFKRHNLDMYVFVKSCPEATNFSHGS